MEDVRVIGIDLAKRSFQVHGARADGSVAYRGKLLGFLASHTKCTVAMEACAGAHCWGREIVALGHEVRLVPPIVPPISLDSILATVPGSEREEAVDVSEYGRAGFGEEPRSTGRPAEAVERAAEVGGRIAAAARRGHRRGEPGGSGGAAGAGAVAAGVSGG